MPAAFTSISTSPGPHGGRANGAKRSVSRWPRSRDSRRSGTAGSSVCSLARTPASEALHVARFAAEGDFALASARSSSLQSKAASAAEASAADRCRGRRDSSIR